MREIRAEDSSRLGEQQQPAKATEYLPLLPALKEQLKTNLNCLAEFWKVDQKAKKTVSSTNVYPELLLRLRKEIHIPPF